MVGGDDEGTGGLVLGLGCARGATTEEVMALAIHALQLAGFPGTPLRMIASLDARAPEPAFVALAAHFDVPFVTFDPTRLEAETPRLAHPSEAVYRRVGCHGVAEAAALAAAGPRGRLVVPKRVSAHVTAAVACLEGESIQVVAAGSFGPESVSSCDESPAWSLERAG